MWPLVLSSDVLAACARDAWVAVKSENVDSLFLVGSCSC